jgi:hypothetical protein
MSYGSINGRFTAKADIDKEGFDEAITKIVTGETGNDTCLLVENGAVSVADRTIEVSFSDDVDYDDFEQMKEEWAHLVRALADFSNGAVKISDTYENGDGDKDENTDYVGPETLVLLAQIRDLEDERDEIEVRIARKRQALGSLGT